ncbi:uncharacterized protein LOC129230154 [Uloborus diversus]|uniref:uncharacterized protein LOC129230154 n=1 Tax=Uloborus diversus TaxID=327109 RepID=UPI0024098318|nr:uncharacterized protein LOC129230154 [Uloborus diversus]
MILVVQQERVLVLLFKKYYCDIYQIGFQKLCGLQRHRQSKQHRDTLIKNFDAVRKSLSNLPPSPAPIPKKATKELEVICCNECLEEFSSIKDFVPHRLSHFSVQNKYLEIDELNPYVSEICNDEMDSHSNVQHHLFWHLQFKTVDDKIATAKKSNLSTVDKLGGQHVAKKSFNLQNCELLQEVTVGGIKKSLFTCDSCNIGFTTKAHYNVHVRKFCKMKKKITQFSLEKAKGFVEKEIFLHCTDDENKGDSHINGGKSINCSACYSLFSTIGIYDKHKKFCSNYYHEVENLEPNKDNVEYIRSAMELQCSIAGCISCN